MENAQKSELVDDFKPTTREFFLKRWLKGEIKLWKAIVFLQLFGWFIAMAVATLSLIVFPPIFSIMLKAILLPTYAIYSSVCVFRASPNPKISIKGAIAKLWAIIFCIYGLAITYTTIVKYL